MVREQQGFSVSEIAAVSDVKESRLQALEAGQLDPDFELMLNVAESMGVRPSAFIIKVEELRAAEKPGEDE